MAVRHLALYIFPVSPPVLRYAADCKSFASFRNKIFERLDRTLKELEANGVARGRKSWLHLIKDICLYRNAFPKKSKGNQNDDGEETEHEGEMGEIK